MSHPYEDFFHDELELFKDQTLKEFARRMLKLFPDYFWEVPSSSTSKYHSAWSNTKPLGLAKHTKAVARIVDMLSDAYSLTPEEHDVAMIAAFAHDSVKYGFTQGKHTAKNHELQGAQFFDKVASRLMPEGFPLLEEVLEAIKYHQGRWSTTEPSKKFPEEFGRIAQLMHIADMVASRKDITFTFIEEASLIG